MMFPNMIHTYMSFLCVRMYVYVHTLHLSVFSMCFNTMLDVPYDSLSIPNIYT